VFKRSLLKEKFDIVYREKEGVGDMIGKFFPTFSFKISF
jgi:hypothetical protein